jgi:hypothetical protein
MIPPDAGASPAILAKRAAMAAVPRGPLHRPGITPAANAAAMASLMGGKTFVYGRGIELPGILVDMIAGFPVVGALLGTNRWLQAERIEQRLLRPGRGLAPFLASIAELDVGTILRHPQVLERLTFVALVKPGGDFLAVRGRLPGDLEDRTLSTRVEGSSHPMWVAGPRLVTGHLVTERMPKVLKLYAWRPVGVVPGCRPVELPGGIVFSPGQRRRRVGDSFNDLPLALAELGLRAKAGVLGLDRGEHDRLAAGAKVPRNVAAYGGPVEFNQGTGSHPAWGPFGRLPGSTVEEPGWLTDPAVGALVTAGCELIITILELLIAEAGGFVPWVDTDAGFITVAATGTPLDVEGRGSTGGPIPQRVGSVTPSKLIGILNRFGPMAKATRLSIPAYGMEETSDGFRMHEMGSPGDLYSVFKIPRESLVEDRWAHGLTSYATAQKRYVLRRRGTGPPKASAILLGTLANFRPGGELDWQAVEEAWGIGPDLAEGREPDGPIRLDLEEPVLQPLDVNEPRDWRALGVNRFSSVNPEGIRPFETVLVPVPKGAPRARLAAFLEPDRSRWARLEFRDSKGRAYVVRTPKELGTNGGSRATPVQVVPSLREWLTDYFGHPQPMSVGPDGRPCGELTRGVLTPAAVRIRGVRVAGQEPHRRRDEESVAGWDVRVTQTELGRVCRAPGCTTPLEGAQRQWCRAHKQHPGERRKRWLRGEG